MKVFVKKKDKLIAHEIWVKIILLIRQITGLLMFHTVTKVISKRLKMGQSNNWSKNCSHLSLFVFFQMNL